AMAAAVEGELHPVVDEPLPQEPRAQARLGKDIDGALLQQPRPDARAQVLGAAPLQHDAVDPGQAEQPRQQQPRRSGTDDSNLGSHGSHVGETSSNRLVIQLSCRRTAGIRASGPSGLTPFPGQPHNAPESGGAVVYTI